MSEVHKTEEQKIAIVLTDALPYELDMLDAAALLFISDEFPKLASSKDAKDWFTKNAAVEAFWTHARCLIEFFTRAKNNNFDASSASARDFTEGFWPSPDMLKLKETISLRINEQVSHVGFCRKAELWEKLGPEMIRVKAIIGKELAEFERKLTDQCGKLWKRKRATVPFTFLPSNVNTTTTFQSGGIWPTPFSIKPRS